MSKNIDIEIFSAKEQLPNSKISFVPVWLDCEGWDSALYGERREDLERYGRQNNKRAGF